MSVDQHRQVGHCYPSKIVPRVGPQSRRPAGELCRAEEEAKCPAEGRTGFRKARREHRRYTDGCIAAARFSRRVRWALPG